MLLYVSNLRDSIYRESLLSLLVMCNHDFSPALSSSRLIHDIHATEQDKLRAYLREKDVFHQYLLFVEQDVVIGMVNFVETYDGIEVDTICVHPSYRNQGIAKAFYDYLFQLCAEHHLLSVLVACNKTAYSHIGLLKSLGFTTSDESNEHVFYAKKSA